jgi:hypothetical protein
MIKKIRIHPNQFWKLKDNEYFAVYYKADKWRIYSSHGSGSASYSLRTEKDKQELISEVCEVKKVVKNKVNLVKISNVILKVSK